MLVCWQLLGGHHQNGQIAVACPDGFGKGIAVHSRHHYVQHHQIDMFFFQNVQGILAIHGNGNVVARALQDCLHQQPRIFIIIRNQNVDHTVHLILLRIQ